MKSFNNKFLVVALIVLGGIFILTRVYRAPALESNIRENVFTLDTAKITSIDITTPKKEMFTLTKTGGRWTISNDEKTAGIDKGLFNNMLKTLSNAKPDRVVTRNEDKWSTYNVDTTGTAVKFLSGDLENLNLIVGRTSGGATYVRVDDGSNVYAVRPTLDSYFNKDFNGWRDKTFVQLKSEDITSLEFKYPADSGFVVSKGNGGKWMIDNTAADSLEVIKYLNKNSSRTLSSFSDKTPETEPTYSITLKITDNKVATIKAWKKSNDQWILSSPAQDNTYFSYSGDYMINEIFVSQKRFEKPSD